jgi:hypothetical protein
MPMRHAASDPPHATIHPSAVLRAPDSEGRRAAYDMLVDDLRVVAQIIDDE